MAQFLTPDDFDFSAYEAMTQNAQKVRPAKDFFQDVVRSFARKESGHRHPRMTSTKVGQYLDFPAGNVTVWAGFNGHKKSMLTGQVALDLCSAGERTLVASMEMPPAETLVRMSRQASGTNRPSDAWLAGFHDWTDKRLWIFDHVGKVTPAAALGLCRYFAEELKGKHVFLDSLMKCVASEESMDDTKAFITDLTQVAQDTGLHIHLVAHCRKPSTAGETLPPTKYDIKGSSSISDQASNVVLVWFNKAKQEALRRNANDEEQLKKPDALVIVDKQRHGTWEGKLGMWFDDASLRFVDDRTSPIEPYSLQGVA
jgi:twinkle protein